MAVQVATHQLYKAFQKIGQVLEKRASDILTSLVCLKACKDEQKLVLMATDYENTINLNIPAYIESDWEGALEGHEFFHLVREIDYESISLDLIDNKNILITSDGLSCEMPLIPHDHIQALNLEKIEGDSFDSGDLLNLLEKVSFAVGDQAFQINLSGVYVRPYHGKLNAIATNGYLVAWNEVGLGQTSWDDNFPPVLIPGKSVGILLKILKADKPQFKFKVQNNYLLLELDNVLLKIRLIDREYVNIDSVYPRQFSSEILIDKQKLISVLRRISLFSGDRSRSVAIQLKDDQLNITSLDSQASRAQESIALKRPAKGALVELRVNSLLLLDSLSRIEDAECKISYDNVMSPFLISSKNEDYREKYLMTPLRSR